MAAHAETQAWQLGERELLGHSHDSSSRVPPQLPLTDRPNSTNDLFVQNYVLHTDTPVSQSECVSVYLVSLIHMVCELAYNL